MARRLQDDIQCFKAHTNIPSPAHARSRRARAFELVRATETSEQSESCADQTVQAAVMNDPPQER